jgi:hypothetical protein
MAKRRYRKRRNPAKANEATTSAVTDTQAARKAYASLRWPELTIGPRIKFRGGFFVSDEPALQRIVENATGFGVYIQDVTSAVKRKLAMRQGGKLYLCFQRPCLEIERFRALFQDGVLETENPSIQALVENFPGFGREIREIKGTVLLEAAAASEEKAQAVA